MSLYEFSASDSYEGHVTNVGPIASYVNETGGASVNESVTWSRVRYTGYCLLVVDSQPGQWHGATSKLTVRGLAENGTELDRVTLVR